MFDLGTKEILRRLIDREISGKIIVLTEKIAGCYSALCRERERLFRIADSRSKQTLTHRAEKTAYAKWLHTFPIVIDPDNLPTSDFILVIGQLPLDLKVEDVAIVHFVVAPRSQGDFRRHANPKDKSYITNPPPSRA